jgi:hypothetical protein
VRAGDKVVVGLASAARDQGDLNWLFGGSYGRETHACPAREAALAAVVGTVAAVLDRTDLRHARRLVFAFDAPPERAQ